MTNIQLMELLSSVMDGAIVLDQNGKQITDIQPGAYGLNNGKFYTLEDFQQGRVPTENVMSAVKILTK